MTLIHTLTYKHTCTWLYCKM